MIKWDSILDSDNYFHCKEALALMADLVAGRAE